MNSPYFSLKDFNFEHCNTYSIMFEYPFVKNDQVEIRTTKLIAKNELFPSRKSIKFSEKQIPKDTVLDIKFFYNIEELPFLKQNLLSILLILFRKLYDLHPSGKGRTIYSCHGILS